MARNYLVHAKPYANMSVGQLRNQLQKSKKEDAKVAADMQWVLKY